MCLRALGGFYSDLSGCILFPWTPGTVEKAPHWICLEQAVTVGVRGFWTCFSSELEECHEITWCLDSKGKLKNVSLIPPWPVESKQWARGPLQGAASVHWACKGNARKRQVSKPGPLGLLWLSKILKPVNESQDIQGKSVVDPRRKLVDPLVHSPTLMGMRVVVVMKIVS